MKTAAKLIFILITFCSLSCFAQMSKEFSVNGKPTDKTANTPTNDNDDSDTSSYQFLKKHPKGEIQTTLGKLWYDEAPLSAIRSYVPFKTSSQLPFYIAVGAAIILLLIFKYGGGSEFGDDYSDFLIRACIFLLLSLTQTFYILTYEGNPLWFFNPDRFGWPTTIAVWIGMLVNYKCLYEMFRFHIHNINAADDRHHHNGIGIACWGWTIFFGVLYFWGVDQERDWVLWFFLGSQLVQFIIWAADVFKEDCSWGRFATNCLYYIVGSFSVLLYLFLFIYAAPIPSTIFVILIFIFSGSVRPCCGNCRTYRNGYCHYKNCNVDSDDCCSSHQR